MSHTVFSAVTEVKGQLAALGTVDVSLATKLEAIETKVDALTTKVDALTEALSLSVNGLSQMLLNVQNVIGSPGDTGG